MNNNAYIKAIAYYLPERVVSNEELVAEFPEWTVEKIAAKVGVERRHVAADDETAGDMAIKAAERLLADNADIRREDIDFVLLCTQSPDYFLPSTACTVQHRLGLPTSCGALDFDLGCSGYEYGLALAKGLVVSGTAHNVLLLTSETYTKHIHPRDKGNRTIFGDAATATVVAAEGFASIGAFSLGTDGGGAGQLIVRTGGMRHMEPLGDVEFDEGGNPQSSDHLYMNGAEIFAFTLRAVPPMVRDTLAKNGLGMDDINLFVFHQANSFMLDHLRRKLKISPDKFFTNLANVGNTVSSTIPIALCDAKAEGRLHGNILLAGFGVGLSWGATILRP